MCELARPVIVANVSKLTISRIGNKLKRFFEWLIETDKDITTTVNGIYKNKKDRQLQGTWYKMHLTLSHKRDPGLCLVFQLRHWLAIWYPKFPHPPLHLTVGVPVCHQWSDRQGKQHAPILSAGSPLFSVHLQSKAFVVNSSFKYLVFGVMTFNISFYSYSQGIDILWGKCTVIHLWKSLWFLNYFN